MGGGTLIDDSQRGLAPFSPGSLLDEPVFVREFDDEALGLRIVDSEELAHTITKIMDSPTGGFATQVRNDFNSNPQLPLRRLRNSHWDSEQDRLLYLRCYYELLSSIDGGTPDRDAVFGGMMAFEIDRQAPHLVVSGPPTPKEKRQLIVLRAVARYEYDEREAARELQEFLDEVKRIEGEEYIQAQTRIMRVDLRGYPIYTHGPRAAVVALGEKLIPVLKVMNVVLDFVPIVGTLKGIAEGIIGYDMTGRKLAAWERGLGALISIIPGAKTAFKAGTGGVRALAIIGAKAVKRGQKAEDVYRVMKVASKLEESAVRAAMISGKTVSATERQAVQVMLSHLDEMEGASRRTWRAASGTIDNGVSKSRTASGVIDTAKKAPGKVIAATQASKATVARLTKAGVSADAIAQLQNVGVVFSRRLVAAIAKSQDAVSFVNRFHKCPGFAEVVKDLGISAGKQDGALFSMAYALKHVEPKLAIFELPAGITKRAKSTEVAARRVDITVRADRALGQATAVSHELKSWELHTLRRALEKPTQLVKDTAIFGRGGTRWVFNSAKINKKQIVAEFKKAISNDPYLSVKWPTGAKLDKALEELIVMFP